MSSVVTRGHNSRLYHRDSYNSFLTRFLASTLAPVWLRWLLRWEVRACHRYAQNSLSLRSHSEWNPESSTASEVSHGCISGSFSGLPSYHLSIHSLGCFASFHYGRHTASGPLRLLSTWNVLSLPVAPLAPLYHLAPCWMTPVRWTLYEPPLKVALVFSHWPYPSFSGFMSLISSCGVFHDTVSDTKYPILQHQLAIQQFNSIQFKSVTDS